MDRVRNTRARFALRHRSSALACAVVAALGLVATGAAQAQNGCSVRFRLTTAVELTDIQFDVGYSAARQAVPSDEIDGCIADIPNAVLAYNDDSESMILTLGLIRPQPFAGPTDIATCRFSHSTIPVEADDLAISVTAADALPPGGGTPVPVVPLPTVIAAEVDCSSPTTTTTTTSTSTSTSSTTTTTLPASGGTCLLTTHLDAALKLGALVFDVHYDPALVDFITGPIGERCVAAQWTHQLSTSNDQAGGSLRIALAAGSKTIDGPTGVTHCSLSFVGDEPQLADFDVSTVLALPLNGPAITPVPSVSAISLQCPADAATTTTLPMPTTTTTLPTPGCGLPVSTDDHTDAADALYILRAVFGESECELCVCDVNSSGTLTVVDVQLALHKALGLPAVMNCPSCD